MKHPTIPRCFTVTALLLLVLLVSGRVGAQTLVLHHANGTTTDVELYNMPLIQFDGDKVTITSTVLDMEYPKENVLRFTYRGSADAIKTVKADANYSLEDGQLVFHGIKQSDDVAVYNAIRRTPVVQIVVSGIDGHGIIHGGKDRILCRSLERSLAAKPFLKITVHYVDIIDRIVQKRDVQHTVVVLAAFFEAFKVGAEYVIDYGDFFRIIYNE